MSTPPNSPNIFTQPDQVPVEPTILRAGDSWEWQRVFPGYPSGEGWTLQYALNSPGGAIFQFPSGFSAPDPDGQSFYVALTSAQTAGVAPGTYDFYAILSNSILNPPQRQTFELETVKIEPAIFGAATSIDTRSFAKKTVDALKAAISGDTSLMVQEYEIHGRKVKYMDKMQLEKLLTVYELRYRQERIDAGEFVPKRVARIVF